MSSNESRNAADVGITEEEDPRQKRHTLDVKTIMVVSVIAVFALIAVAVVLRFATGASNQPPKSAAAKGQTPTVMTAQVFSQTVSKDLRLPGELRAYQNVAIYPKVQAFVEAITVDRGSIVHRGQLLVRMSAPEMTSHTSESEARVRAAREQRLEMESRVQSVREQRAEAEAKMVSDEGTYRRLKAASATPGVVAENDV